MTRLVIASSAFALGLCAPAALVPQSVFDSIETAYGMCRVWAPIPGGSSFPKDASYSRCALDRGPLLLAGEPMPPPPRYGRYAGGSFMVVVNANGTVDSQLTRAWTRGMDTAFHRRALETIRQWRFEPGSRQGETVRSGFTLQLKSNGRNDTLPARLEWSYKPGLNADTLAGTWVAEAPLPPFARGQIDSVYVAMLRRLVKMQVILPGPGNSYCLVHENGDSTAHARLSQLAEGIVHAERRWGALAAYGCEALPGMLRIVLPRVHRAESGRAVLQPSGDYLPNWPPGFDGRSWHAWNGRCVADVPAQGSVWIDCSVEPEYSLRELAERERRRGRGAHHPSANRSDTDSIEVSVVVTTLGAYQTDTLRAVVARALPRLGARAINDPEPPCGGWAAFSLQDSSELYVIKGDPSGHSLDLTRVTHGLAPTGPRGAPRCGHQEPRRSQFVTFLIGNIGDPATAPTTLCFSSCTKSYLLDPVRHTLAERAHLQFRLSDLREDTRVGEQLTFRIYADPAPAKLLPLVLIRTGDRWSRSAWIAPQVATNAWDYGVTFTGGYSPDTEVHIYLITP